MFDGAWAEFILLAIIALIFLGPRELISLCRTLGRCVGKIRILQENFMHHVHTVTDDEDDRRPPSPSNHNQPS